MPESERPFGLFYRGEAVVCLRLSHGDPIADLGSNPDPGLLTLILGFCLPWSSSLWEWISDRKHLYRTNLCGFFFPFFQGQVLSGQKSPWRLWYQSGTGNQPGAQGYICIIVGPSWHSRMNHLVLPSGDECPSLASRLSISSPSPFQDFSLCETWSWRLHLSTSLISLHGSGVRREASSVALGALWGCRVLRLRNTLEECLPRTWPHLHIAGGMVLLGRHTSAIQVCGLQWCLLCAWGYTSKRT